MKIDAIQVIDAYTNGMSLNAIAREFHTYPTVVSRILVKHGVTLRHDNIKKDTTVLTDGDKLIEWAKAQGRLVTKTELAQVVGKTRLSNSYFKHYPELSQYIKPREQSALTPYVTKLYDWLQQNGIPYKPHDKVILNGTPVTATLLGLYKGKVAVQLAIKLPYVSQKRFETEITNKKEKAYERGIDLILLGEDDLDKLDEKIIKLD